MSETPKDKRISRKKIISVLLVIILLLITIAVGIFVYTNYKDELNLPGSSKAGSENEVEELVIKVGKLIKLPNETPEIATVLDIEKLRDQSIFKDAQNGDKVLIFSNAKRAIVYRPSENVIIEVGNLVVAPGGTPSAEIDQEAQEKLSIVVFNGTSTAGLASRVGSSLESKFSNIEITDTGNATSSYQKTIVVDVSGDNSDTANALAEELDGEVGALPEGEEEPDSDILIILGQ